MGGDFDYEFEEDYPQNDHFLFLEEDMITSDEAFSPPHLATLVMCCACISAFMVLLAKILNFSGKHQSISNELIFVVCGGICLGVLAFYLGYCTINLLITGYSRKKIVEERGNNYEHTEESTRVVRVIPRSTGISGSDSCRVSGDREDNQEEESSRSHDDAEIRIVEAPSEMIEENEVIEKNEEEELQELSIF